MKKVLYIWKDSYPWDVRVEKFCRSFVENGWDTYLLARSRGSNIPREIIDGFNVIRVGCGEPEFKFTPVPYNIWWDKAIESAVKEIKPDLIIVREILLGINSGNIAEKYDIPIIMDMAEHYPAAMRGWAKYTDPLLMKLLVHYFKVPDYVEKKAIKKMNGIIVVCDEQKERLNADYDYPMENIEVVFNTPHISLLENIRTGTGNPPKIFAYHGYFTPDRNLDMMIKGFILAATEISDIELKIAGGGDNSDDFKSLALRSPVADRIEFYGSYNHSDLIKYYSETDIAILPYKPNMFINHTISNKFFDYALLGKPMITSLAKPMQRLIEKHKIGLSCDCANAASVKEAIIKLLHSDYQQMSSNGLKLRNEYIWELDSDKLQNFALKYL